MELFFYLLFRIVDELFSRPKIRDSCSYEIDFPKKSCK